MDRFTLEGIVTGLEARVGKIEDGLAAHRLREAANSMGTTVPTAESAGMPGANFWQQSLGAAANFLEGLPVSLSLDFTKSENFTTRNPFGVTYSFALEGEADAKLTGTPQ